MNQRLNKFLQDANKLNSPLSIDLWKEWFEIAELFGVESKQFEGFKQAIPNKFRLPAKKFIKSWLQINEEKEEIFQALVQFLKSLDFDEDLLRLIQKDFKSENIKKAEQLLLDQLQYFSKNERLEHLNTLNKLFQNYHHRQIDNKLHTVEMNYHHKKKIQEPKGRSCNVCKVCHNLNNVPKNLILIKDREKGNEGKKMFPNQYSAADYIVDSLKQKELWWFEQKSEEAFVIGELKKSPQLFVDIILKSVGRTGPYRKFIRQMKEDNVLKNLILKQGCQIIVR